MTNYFKSASINFYICQHVHRLNQTIGNVRHNIGTYSCNHFCSGKAIIITYSVCVFVASVIHHAKRMRHIILSSVACLAVPYFTTLYCHLWPVWLYHILPHYLKNGTIFWKMLLSIKGLFCFSPRLLSEIFIILRRTERDVIINIRRSSCKAPAIFGRV